MDSAEAIAFIRAVAPVCRELGVTRIRVDVVEFDVYPSPAALQALEPAPAAVTSHEAPDDDLTPPDLADLGVKVTRRG